MEDKFKTLVLANNTKKKEDSTEPQHHKFWSKQPVAQDALEIQKKKGPVELKTLEDVSKTPLKLPEEYEWCLLDWDDPEVLQEAYVLLRDNYVEDDQAMFRFDYSKPFLKWALQPPGWLLDWQLGVRQVNNKKLRAMITGTPAHVSIIGDRLKVTEINFLCVHQKLRKYRLAPVLIREITRRVNLQGIWQAVYTAGVKIPTPITKARYYHRSLNPRKLVDVGFSHLRERETMTRLLRLLALPDSPNIATWRPTEKKDIPRIGELVGEYLKKFKVRIEFEPEELEHWFLPRPGVISSFVVTNEKGDVTDFGSYYHLYSSVLQHDKHKEVRVGDDVYKIAEIVEDPTYTQGWVFVL